MVLIFFRGDLRVGHAAWFGLSLAPLVTSRGFLELKQGPSRAEARCGLVGDAEGQAGRGVDARVTEVEAGAAAAPEAWKSKRR